MKYLAYSTGPMQNALGDPIIIPELDRSKMRQAEKDARAENAKRASPLPTNEVSWQIPVIENATFEQCLLRYCNEIPWGEVNPQTGRPKEHPTMTDQEHALHVIRALRGGAAVDGTKYVEIEENALKWLMDGLKENGHYAFNGVVPALLVEGLNKNYPEPPEALKLYEKSTEVAAVDSGSKKG